MARGRALSPARTLHPATAKMLHAAGIPGLVVNGRLASSEASRAGKMCQFPGKAVSEIVAGLGCDQAAIGGAI